MKKNLPSAESQVVEQTTAPVKLSSEALINPAEMPRSEKDARSYIADPMFEQAPALPEELFNTGHDEEGEGNAEQESVPAGSKPEEAGILDEIIQKQQETIELSQSAYHNQKKRIQDQKIKKRMSAVKRFSLIFVTLAVLASLLYFLPAFHVQSFQVEGLNNLREDEVIAVSEIEAGEHVLAGWGGSIVRFLGLRNGGAEDRIKDRFPFVDSVAVRPLIPGKIRIMVDERVPVSYVDHLGEIVLLDKDGIVLDMKKTLNQAIPIIYNLKLENPVPGDMISEESKKAIRPAILVLDALVSSDTTMDDGFSLFSEVKSITLTEGAETYITLSQAYASPETRIKLGNRQTLAEAINWLRYAARTDNLMNLGKGTLDITGTRKYFYPNNDEN